MESTAESPALNFDVDDKIMNSLYAPQSSLGKDTSFSQNGISEEESSENVLPVVVVEQLCTENVLNETERPNGDGDVTGLADFVSPDANLVSDILSQVEYYFSDDNLPKDKFLLQQISRDKYGFVALSVIATFKKMKMLTTVIQSIAFALRQSSKLEVSKNGTRVRRTHSLPADNEKLLKTVVAVNLQEPTVHGVKQQFAICGPVNQVSVICRGEFVTGADVRRQVRGGLDSFGKALTGIALIEYDNLDSAHAACQQLTGSGNWRNDLHVSMLTIVSTGSKKHSMKQKDIDLPNTCLGENGVENETEKKLKQKSKNLVHSRAGELTNEECSANTSINQQFDKVCYITDKSDCLNRSPRLNCRNPSNEEPHNKSSEESKEEAIFDQNQSGSKGVSPWIQRRLKASQVNGESSYSSITADSDTDGLKKSVEVITVLRQPKGPDGSKGFCVARV